MSTMKAARRWPSPGLLLEQHEHGDEEHGRGDQRALAGRASVGGRSSRSRRFGARHAPACSRCARCRSACGRCGRASRSCPRRCRGAWCVACASSGPCPSSLAAERAFDGWRPAVAAGHRDVVGEVRRTRPRARGRRARPPRPERAPAPPRPRRRAACARVVLDVGRDLRDVPRAASSRPSARTPASPSAPPSRMRAAIRRASSTSRAVRARG